MAALEEFFRCCRRFYDLGVFGIRDGEMKVAPVDAEIVSGAVQRLLVARADVEHGKTCSSGTPPDHWLVAAVDCDARIGVEIESYLMTVTVGCPRLPGEISDGPGK